MSTLQSLEQEAYHAVLLVLATQPLDWVRNSQQCPSHVLLQFQSPASGHKTCLFAGEGGAALQPQEGAAHHN